MGRRPDTAIGQDTGWFRKPQRAWYRTGKGHLGEPKHYTPRGFEEPLLVQKENIVILKIGKFRFPVCFVYDDRTAEGQQTWTPDCGRVVLVPVSSSVWESLKNETIGERLWIDTASGFPKLSGKKRVQAEILDIIPPSQSRKIMSQQEILQKAKLPTVLDGAD